MNKKNENESFCYQCKTDQYCKEPRLDSKRGRDVLNKTTDKIEASVTITIKMCHLLKK